MDEEISIPTHIDEPIHILLWQWDEVLPIAVGLIFGIWVSAPILGIAAGVILKRSYVKVRDGKPRGYFFHKLRESGLIPAKAGKHSMMQSLVKEYIA